MPILFISYIIRILFSSNMLTSQKWRASSRRISYNNEKDHVTEKLKQIEHFGGRKNEGVKKKNLVAYEGKYLEKHIKKPEYTT